jgi:threonyl-tRNA synthetase
MVAMAVQAGQRHRVRLHAVNLSSLRIVTRDDPRALELIRHDAAHVMAEAVQALWPGTQVTIGPVIENGFLLRLQARPSGYP